MNEKTKKLTTLAMLCAMAYLIVALIRIPMIPALPFLKYEPKDVIITIGGFIFGPLPAMLISAIVSLIEMVTFSTTGIIGCIMNFLSTISFACVAAFLYKKKHTLKGAVLGLVSGIAVMTVVMLLWNYLITPLYMGYPREAVAAMLLPGFLPFNLIKGTLNACITMLLYKPVVMTLRKTGLITASKTEETGKESKIKAGVVILSLLVLVTCIMIILVIQGII
ncbi:MAG: ECF transporter S component [Lachnospiraceae bacterium]